MDDQYIDSDQLESLVTYQDTGGGNIAPIKSDIPAYYLPSSTWKVINYWFSVIFLILYLGFSVIAVLSVFSGSSGDFPIQLALPLWILGSVALGLLMRYSSRLSRGVISFYPMSWFSYQAIPFIYLVYAHNFLPGHGSLAHLPLSGLILFMAMPLTKIPLHYMLLPVQLYLMSSWSENLKKGLGYVSLGGYFVVLTPLYQELISLKSSSTLRDLGAVSYAYYLPLLVALPYIAWGLAQLVVPSLRKSNGTIMAVVITASSLALGTASLAYDRAESASMAVDAGSSAACSENYLSNSPELITFMRSGDLWLTDSNGRSAIQITHGAGNDYLVPHTVSPDGKYIAYAEARVLAARGQYGQNEEASIIHIVNLSTMADTVLSTSDLSGHLYGAMEWSAQQELKFKFSSSFDNYTEYAFSLDGKPLNPSSVIPVLNGRNKVISPDSQYSIKNIAKSGYTQHYIAKISGDSHSVELPKGVSYVRWLNDSKRIVLMSPDGLKVMDVCGNSKGITSSGADRAPIEH